MILTLIFLAFMTSVPVKREPAEPAAFKSVACDFFGGDNAANLLGTNFRGEDGGMTEDAQRRVWKCTFMRDPESETKSPRIHFMIEKAATVEAADKSFDDMRLSNENKPGWNEWKGIGDEATVHSDGANFHLVMVRKDVRTIRIKANPVGDVSLERLKEAAEMIAAKL
jgi:hypothetical protein